MRSIVPPLHPVQAAKEVLRDSVLPSLTDASVQHALSSSTLDTHLLGFETGGEPGRAGGGIGVFLGAPWQLVEGGQSPPTAGCRVCASREWWFAGT